MLCSMNPHKPRGSWWTVLTVFGAAVGVTAGLLGLVVVGMFVLFFTGIASFGSNK